MPFIVYGSITNYDPRPPESIKLVISNVSSGWDISGVSSGSYTIYGIRTANTTCTMNINVISPATMYLFMVGGGGAGGADIGGGGGGGDVIPTALTIPICTAQTLTCRVGSGGAAATTNPTYLNNGGNTYISGLPSGTVISNYPTTLSYTTTSTTQITAFGGGYGTTYPNNPSATGSIGGSSGGVGAYTNTNSSSVVNTANWNSNFTFINNAYRGGYNLNYKLAAGGGGSGAVGGNVISSSTPTRAGVGGSGIQCTLPGISTYNPLGTPYGNYYWGGGGGGGGNNDGTSGSPGNTNGFGGNGGLGGGGGGAVYNNSTAGTGGAGLNNGSGGTAGTAGSGIGYAGGAGGANTGGGGGGGSGYSGAGGAGGSGILLIAVSAI